MQKITFWIYNLQEISEHILYKRFFLNNCARCTKKYTYEDYITHILNLYYLYLNYNT